MLPCLFSLKVLATEKKDISEKKEEKSAIPSSRTDDTSNELSVESLPISQQGYVKKIQKIYSDTKKEKDALQAQTRILEQEKSKLKGVSLCQAGILAILLGAAANEYLTEKTSKKYKKNKSITKGEDNSD